MPQATCRITTDLNELLDEGATEAGLFRSDIFRRALVHYLDTNPDHLETFGKRDVPDVRTVESREHTDEWESSQATDAPTADRS